MEYWLQRHMYWTLDRAFLDMLAGEPFAPRRPGDGLEQRWRRRRFRLHKPGLWERLEVEEEIRRQVDRYLAA
jgi:hypothetical protein